MWTFGIIDALDILSVAIILYYLYRMTRKSGTFVIFQAIVIIFIVWIVVSQIIKMRLLGSILDGFIEVGLIAIIVIFSSEIRRTLIRFGSRYQLHSLLSSFSRSDLRKGDSHQWIDEIVHACRNMSAQKVGALIVIQGHDDLSDFVTQGEEIDARITTRLIEQIFYKNTPLHDGAMIITGNRIHKAGCVLPVSHNTHLDKSFGLRHRAAMGLAELTDSRIIVVSEETGHIALFSNARYNSNLSATTLQSKLIGKKETKN
ncbi:MAG: TIGR00159 family protein [Bacteroidales bacterium]|nr:TIGR00159 family protein [Bacteroidales bacterium]